ncbi:replication protein [Escherichia coli M056]|nr:replication protein [Escherichia coli M056]
MGKTTNAVVCSYATLTEVTGYSRRSVATAIKILKDDRWIQVVKVGNASAYCINEKVIWQAGRNQRKYAIFSATVVASESEQESDYHLKKRKN